MLTRLVTRCLGIIPSLVVAIAVGRDGISTLLVASQVVLSIVLPFVTLPLIYFTSSPHIMTVYEEVPAGVATTTTTTSSSASTSEESSADEDGKEKDVPKEEEDVTAGVPVVAFTVAAGADPERGAAGLRAVDFSNGKIMVAIGAVIWLIIVAANVYAIVGLAMGEA